MFHSHTPENVKKPELYWRFSGGIKCNILLKLVNFFFAPVNIIKSYVPKNIDLNFLSANGKSFTQ